jgi:hypothetical protein
MKTEQTLTYFLTCILICGGFVSLAKAQKRNKTGKQKGTVSVKPLKISEVESVTFDKETVFLVCPFYETSKESEKLKVSTIAKNTEKEELSYYYFVSGGKILGEGSNIIWDFSGMRPGEYSMTVGVGKDFIISGKTITKKIIVQDPRVCDPPCACPQISVLGTKSMPKHGETIIFTNNVESEKNREFHWTVSGGIIIAGQGTSQIMVKTSNDASFESVSVTLEVKGYDFCADCQMEKKTTVYFRKD